MQRFVVARVSHIISLESIFQAGERVASAGESPCVISEGSASLAITEKLIIIQKLLSPPVKGPEKESLGAVIDGNFLTR